MSGRGATASVLTEIAKDNQRFAHLVHLEFSASDVYVTDFYKTLTYATNDYLPGHLVGFGQVTENLDQRVEEISVTLSGVVLANQTLGLGQNVINQPLTIYRAYLNSDGAIVSTPVVLYEGLMDYTEGQEDWSDQGTFNVRFYAANHLTNFQKVSGRRANNTDQQLYASGLSGSPTDLGMEFAGSAYRDIRWSGPK